MEKPFNHALLRRNRLKHKALIDRLFESGQWCKHHPVLAVYGEFDGAFQAGFSVPKRKIRSAVKRNRIKRKLREAFRLHKKEWYAGLEGLRVMFVYLAHTEREYTVISEAIARILQTLASEKGNQIN